MKRAGTRSAAGLLALLLVGGCGARPWADRFPPGTANDVAAIEKTIDHINQAFAISAAAGAEAMAAANYYVFAGVSARGSCVTAWEHDPNFWSYLNDTLLPATVTASPTDEIPDLPSAPLGRLYLFQVRELARFIGESPSGTTGPVHRSIQHFHATVMPDGSALLFVWCAGTLA